MRLWTAVLLASALAAAAQTPPPDAGPFPFGDVRAGLIGTGYTVLSGTQPVPFEAQVIGTTDQGAAQPRMILCKLSGAGLGQSGVLAAMSGSPVYTEGRLLGAVAYTWSFSKESLCGVTPAEDLLAIRAQRREEQQASGAPPFALSRFWSSSAAVSLPAEAEGNIPASEADTMEKRLAAQGFAWSGPGNRGAAVPAPPEPPTVVPGPGGMIGVQLVTGDVQFTAFGTVTWVKGKEFLAFGHPFLGLGSTDLPVVTARVAGIVASLAQGFKLSQAGSPIGTVTQDRATGVYGLFGKEADLLPVNLRLEENEGAGRPFKFALARQRQLTPFLLTGAITTLFSRQVDQSASKTITFKGLTLTPAGHPPVVLQDQSFSGLTALPSAADYLASTVALLSDNPYEKVRLDHIQTTLSWRPGTGSSTLESAWLDRRIVRQGEPLRLTVRLRPYQGEAVTRSMEIPTSDLPPGPVTLWVGNALNVYQKAASSMDQPQTGEGILHFLASIPSDRNLEIAAATATAGVTFGNRHAAPPPPSVGAILSTRPASSSADASTSRLVWTRSLEGTGLVEGLLELTFSVKEPGDEAP